MNKDIIDDSSMKLMVRMMGVMMMAFVLMSFIQNTLIVQSSGVQQVDSEGVVIWQTV